MTIEFILCLNRLGKIRLARFYNSTQASIDAQRKTIQEVYLQLNKISKINYVLNHFTLNETTILFKRFNGLYFIIGVETTENIFKYLHSIQLFVELLDDYFENVSELDLIFNFHKLYFLLDQMYANGHLIVNDKSNLIKAGP